VKRLRVIWNMKKQQRVSFSTLEERHARAFSDFDIFISGFFLAIVSLI
jgi:hypothetical protein